MKRISISTLLLFVLIFSSCKKIVEDVNINPNSPTDAPADLILNGAQVSSIVFYEGDFARLAGMWAKSFTGADRQYISLNSYVTTAGDYDNTWSTAYRGVIAPCQLIIDKSTTINNKIMIGIAQVMQAQAFGTLTSLFGDIPFSEAVNPNKFPAPKFDKQVDVYAGIQTLLDNAIANLSSEVGITPGTKDIFFGGNTQSWVKVANTLKARYYLHTKEYAKAVVAASNGISSASGNMMAPHGESYLTDFNLYYSFCAYDREAYMSAEEAYAPRLLDPTSEDYRGNTKTDEEARGNYLYILGGGIYFGGNEPNILSAFEGFWGISNPEEDGFFGGVTSFPLVTYEENELIKAEANIRNGNASDALNALNAFRAYMSNGGYIGSYYQDEFDLKYEAYEDADFEAGGMENNGESKNDALLKEIVEERYVTLIGQIEQFNDVRRTKNLLGLKPVTGSSIPQRFLYPQSEINTNANTPKQQPADLFKPTTVNL
jgi:hypothetical protein